MFQGLLHPCPLGSSRRPAMLAGIDWASWDPSLPYQELRPRFYVCTTRRACRARRCLSSPSPQEPETEPSCMQLLARAQNTKGYMQPKTGNPVLCRRALHLRILGPRRVGLNIVY